MYGQQPEFPWGRLLTHPVALLAMCLVSLFPTYIVGLGVMVDYRLQKDGRRAVAHVESWRVHHDESIPPTLYEVDYRFKLDGREYGPHWVHRALNMVVHTDDVASRRPKQIDVLYLPDDPACNLPARHQNGQRFPLFLTLCVCLNVGLIAGVFIARAYWRHRDEMFARLAV